MPTKIIRKCCICGKPVISHGPSAKYCPTCAVFAQRLDYKQLPTETVEMIWNYVRQYGYVCYYTGMPLNMTNPHDPFYCVLDHWNPHDNRKLVLTSSLLNDMKTDLTEAEFWYIIRQLANFKRHHTMFRKKKLLYWDRDYERLYIDESPLLGGTKICSRICSVCGKRILHSANPTKYCRICARYIAHMQSLQVPSKTIKEVCAGIHKNGYRCGYTGVWLDVNNSRSPWYCVLDHRVPGDSSKLVPTFALLNEMKSDLTEKEFWYYILQFADYKEKNEKVRKKKITHWFRLYPVEDV